MEVDKYCHKNCKKGEGNELNYHDGDASDTEPRVGESGTSKLKLTKVTDKHNRDKSDQVIEQVGKNHWKWKQELMLGLLHVQDSVPPSPLHLGNSSSVFSSIVIIIVISISDSCP